MDDLEICKRIAEIESQKVFEENEAFWPLPLFCYNDYQHLPVYLPLPIVS